MFIVSIDTRQLATGKESGGDRVVTRKQVARLAGVSEATVSNVINNRVSVNEITSQKVIKAIKQLKYTPNQNARNLVMRRSNHIGIAIYETTNPYHLEISKHIEATAIKQGYIVSMFMLDNNMNDKLEAIRRRRFDGVVNFMTNDYPSEFIETLTASGTILINFDQKYGSIFNNDYYDATYEMLKNMQELGHTKVAYLSTQDEASFKLDSRGMAFLDMKQHGCFSDMRIYYNSNFERASELTGYELGHQIIEDFPEVTAIACTNDLAATGLIRALADNGINVPGDVSVTGCDDISISKILVPALTTITVDKSLVGSDIANQIIDEIAGGERVQKKYTAKLIMRESLATAKT